MPGPIPPRLAPTRPGYPPVTDCATNPRPARLTRFGNAAGALIATWLILAGLTLGSVGVWALVQVITEAVQ